MAAFHKEPYKIIKQIRLFVTEPHICVDMMCGGSVYPEVIALSEENVAISGEDVHCSCGRDDCPWENGLEVQDE